MKRDSVSVRDVGQETRRTHKPAKPGILFYGNVTTKVSGIYDWREVMYCIC